MIFATFFGPKIGWMLTPAGEEAREFLEALRLRYSRLISNGQVGYVGEPSYLVSSAIAGKVAFEAHTAGLSWSV